MPPGEVSDRLVALGYSGSGTDRSWDESSLQAQPLLKGDSFLQTENDAGQEPEVLIGGRQFLVHVEPGPTA